MRSSESRSARRRLVLGGTAVVVVAVAVLAAVLLIRPSAPGPAATVTTLDGTTMTVPDGRPAVLTFVSATCGDCVGDVQTLGALRAEAADRATFLAVGVDPAASAQDLTALLGAAGHPDLPAVQDTDGALLRNYEVATLGTVVVLAPDGTVTYREVKPGTDALRAALSHATTH